MSFLIGLVRFILVAFLLKIVLKAFYASHWQLVMTIEGKSLFRIAMGMLFYFFLQLHVPDFVFTTVFDWSMIYLSTFRSFISSILSCGVLTVFRHIFALTTVF